MANHRFTVREHLIVCVHNTQPPTATEWSAFMAAAKLVPRDKLRLVIFTDGGAPTTLQRGELNDFLAPYQPRMSVVSGNIAARGVGTAISWFNKQFKVFAPAKLASAFEHAEVPAGGRAMVLTAAKTLAQELGGPISAVETAKL